MTVGGGATDKAEHARAAEPEPAITYYKFKQT